MRGARITDNDVVLWKVCHSSRSQDVILLPQLKQVVTQYKMYNDVMLWLAQMMCYNAHIPLPQTNDAGRKSKPYNF